MSKGTGHPGSRKEGSAPTPRPANDEKAKAVKIRLHPHARERLQERGATSGEVVATVREGEQFPAKFGRTGFRRNFSFGKEWRGRTYETKQIEAYAVQEKGWLVITVIVRYF